MNCLNRLMTLKTLKLALIITVVIAGLNSCKVEDRDDIFDKLNALSGVRVTEIEPRFGYPRAFQIDFAQPVNHNDVGGQWFYQRMYLSHVDENLPMVFAPSGYAATERSGQEIAAVLQTNCLNVSHRYFTESRPTPTDWQYLTVWQAATDHHRIVKLFKTIYGGPWVSSGASKSGMTPIFHKRFYPDDVSAIIAYVAPFSFGMDDERYPPFLASIGSAADRATIIDYQRRLLIGRSIYSTMYGDWFPENGHSYSGDPDIGFESRVISYNWTFYQYHDHGIQDIPEHGSSHAAMFGHFAAVTKIERASDIYYDYFKPYYFQAYTELGYPKQNADHLQDLLLYDRSGTPNLAPAYGIHVDFKPETMQSIYNWVQTQGDNIIFIYGGIDPWTAGAVQLTGQTNAIKIVHPGSDHGVKILDLPGNQQALVFNSLSKWLGIQIALGVKRGIRESDDGRRLDMGNLTAKELQAHSPPIQ